MKWALSALGLVLLALSACQSHSGSAIASEVSVSAGHACARMSDATVRCWGAAARGQRGDGVQLDFAPWDLLRNNRMTARSRIDELDRPNQVVNLDEIEEVAAGGVHTCARRKNGTVWCWGSNDASQLADETFGSYPSRLNNRPYPEAVPGLSGVVQITAGLLHTCARRSEGTVWCWGGDLEGQTGHGGSKPAEVPNVAPAVDVRAGGRTTCALIADGTVRCWGYNSHGQIGDGTARWQGVIARPTRVSSVRDSVEVTVGPEHACVRTRAAQLKCWGSNSANQGKVPESLVPLSVGAASKNTCALGPDGSVTCWGDSTLLSAVSPNKSFTAIDGVLGAVGKVPGGKQIVVGQDHVCVLAEGGAVQCWGASWRDQPDKTSYDAQGPFAVEGLGKAVHLANNGARTCAVSADGQVRCWSAKRKIETVDGISDATQVTLGQKHGCARRKKGTVVCWGEGSRGQLARGSLEAGVKPALEVAGLQDVDQLASSALTTCARLKDATVRCWGDNTVGQLGQMTFSAEGPESTHSRPVFVGLPESAVQIAGAAGSMCAVLASGGVACWGDNAAGVVVASEALEKEDKKPPTQVQGLRDAVQIAVAADHACAMTRTGKVMCWGSNEAGQMGDGTLGRGNQRLVATAVAGLARSTHLELGWDVSCGRMPDGTFVCLGNGKTAAWPIPGLPVGSQIALAPAPLNYDTRRAESSSGCAVMANGSLACWGDAVPGHFADGSRSEIPVQVRW